MLAMKFCAQNTIDKSLSFIYTYQTLEKSMDYILGLSTLLAKRDWGPRSPQHQAQTVILIMATFLQMGMGLAFLNDVSTSSSLDSHAAEDSKEMVRSDVW